MAAGFDTQSDAQLVAAISKGQMEALAALVRRHQHRVRALAYRISGRWDVADDVTQETFLRVHRAAARYTPSAAFTTWLYRIIVNLCLDRARQPRLARLEDDAIAHSSGRAERPLVEGEKIEAIRREVEALPERQRIALVLHRFEGQSHAEIAAATGWSESAVESLLSRAYAQLRQRLAIWAE